MYAFNFQFLRQAFADDEASTGLLQILLLSMFIPCAVRSSYTLSIGLHFFGCLPVLLVLFTLPSALLPVVYFPPSLIVTCPNHVSILFIILSISVISCSSSFLGRTCGRFRPGVLIGPTVHVMKA